MSDARTSDAELSAADKKVPLPLKIFGGLNIVIGIIGIPVVVLTVIALVQYASEHGTTIASEFGVSTQAVILYGVSLLCGVALMAQFIVFGIRLIKNKRRGACRQSYVMLGFAIAGLLLDMMTEGITAYLLIDLLDIVFLLVMGVYLDPSLSEERRLQRRLEALENRADAEEGTLGRDKTGKGYITLNFFNLFWIFVIACIVGLIMESLVCPFLNGRIENRTGMIWGPFSPIYGFGALFMTMALNRFYKSNFLIIFICSAFIGGAFEFLVSWFLQFAFGICAWDYSGEPLNIDGRTDALHMVFWGILGLFWVKVLVPWLLKQINRIPWDWRYGVTTAFTVFMLINGGMTLMSFECWFERTAGVTPDTPVAQFFSDNYGDDFMKEHFATMSINPNNATRD